MEKKLTPHEALIDAVNEVGGQTHLARLCNVSQPAVWKWLQSAKRLPAEYVLRVEAATGVSRHLLRPDIYPPEIDLAPAPSAIGDAYDDCGPILSRGCDTAHGKRTQLLAGGGAA